MLGSCAGLAARATPRAHGTHRAGNSFVLVQCLSVLVLRFIRYALLLYVPPYSNITSSRWATRKCCFDRARNGCLQWRHEDRGQHLTECEEWLHEDPTHNRVSASIQERVSTASKLPVPLKARCSARGADARARAYFLQALPAASHGGKRPPAARQRSIISHIRCFHSE